MIWGAIGLMALFYFVFDPVESGFMPQCIFHHLTGLDCAGCGAQRMVHALLHGDIAGAWQANAFLLIMLPFILFMVWLEIKRTKYPVLYKKVYSPLFIIITGVAVTGWFIIRNSQALSELFA